MSRISPTKAPARSAARLTSNGGLAYQTPSRPCNRGAIVASTCSSVLFGTFSTEGELTWDADDGTRALIWRRFSGEDLEDLKGVIFPSC